MTAPAATGQRRSWGELPERVRAATEAWLGSPVAAATTQPTGVSPGVAAEYKPAREAAPKATTFLATTAGIQRRGAIATSQRYRRRAARVTS